MGKLNIDGGGPSVAAGYLLACQTIDHSITCQTELKLLELSDLRCISFKQDHGSIRQEKRGPGSQLSKVNVWDNLMLPSLALLKQVLECRALEGHIRVPGPAISGILSQHLDRSRTRSMHVCCKMSEKPDQGNKGTCWRVLMTSSYQPLLHPAPRACI